MSEDITKKAVDMLLQGATLVRQPCPYCKGVRVIKDGTALCINCGKTPKKEEIPQKAKTMLEILDEKLEAASKELQGQTDHIEQQKIIKTIDSLVEIISKLKKDQ